MLSPFVKQFYSIFKVESIHLLAGSILSGFNLLFINVFSMSWGAFYISSMGGAALKFWYESIKGHARACGSSSKRKVYNCRFHGFRRTPIDAYSWTSIKYHRELKRR